MSDFGKRLRARIMVATPTYTGDTVCEHTQAIQLATMHCLTKGVVLDVVHAPGFSLVQYARNWLTAEFLSRPECTHLLWVDADIGFEANAIMKLVDRNLDAVGGVYTTKHPTKPIYPYESIGPVIDGLQEVRKLPGGFLLLSRRAVESVVAMCEWHDIEHNGETRRSPHVFDLVLNGKQLLGEDFVFTQRLLNAGFKVFVETNITFVHIGRYAWVGNLARTLAQEAEKGVGQGTADAWKHNEQAPQIDLSAAHGRVDPAIC